MLRTLKDIKNLKGRRVLLRVDFNVPHDKKGQITDDTRIKETLPTITYLLKKKAKVIVMSHLGRPDGKVVDSLRLDEVAKRLSRLLKKASLELGSPALRSDTSLEFGLPVKKVDDSIGTDVEKAVAGMKESSVLMLENIRFHKGEETCEKSFVKSLAKLGDIFVNDAFATSHRAHASTFGLAKYLPAYAGFLVEREIKFLSPLLTKTSRPFVLVVGGAKVNTKICLLKNYIGKADSILVGGALANTFLAAEGYDIGSSLFEKDKLEIASEILLLAEKKKTKIVLPIDVIVTDEVSEKAKALDLPLEDIEGEMKILDIGTRTRRQFGAILKGAHTILWNGPMGLYELTPFAGGTRFIAEKLATLTKKSQATDTAKTYLGGGDTLDAIARFKIPATKYTFASTGGGAMLEFLEGKALPGIEVLRK